MINHALNGDRRSIEALTRHAHPRIAGQVARYPLDDEDRIDLVQTVLLQIPLKIRSLRGQLSFDGWLFRLTATAALPLLRSRRRERARFVAYSDIEEVASLPSVTMASLENVVLAERRNARLRHALRDAPADYREVLLARYDEGRSLNEIARTLALNKREVQSRLRGARAHLRSILGDDR
ncbi:RNA polymerase sigma factor [Sorangium atrum]|uniref:RNA polymerase sigma factor n=1 Tax=Sorangium atrum TaxID=2995308 RepID=A0ABT5C857_9BACT|nr:RNA polymerase sigma factor [Sorangium aterium]MDC0682603.1 RNA polymerase sigma factor [Sorangium aterium]